MYGFYYDRPAATWEEGLPIGCGRLGAMVLGGIRQERLPLNQDSIWYGGPIDRVNPQSRNALPQVREWLLTGRIPEAELLMRAALSGTPQSERLYQPLGDLEIVYRGDLQGEPLSYRRALDLSQAVVEEVYETSARKVRKEYLCSYPHGVIALRMTALRGTLGMDLLLRRSRFYDHSGALDDRTVYMDGTLGEGGVRWKAAVRAVCTGGTCQAVGEQLIVRDVRQVDLFIACETSFYSPDFEADLLGRLDHASRDGYDAVRARHIADYRSLFDRVSLDLGQSDDRPIDAQFRDGIQNGFPPAFAALYFQYGRYLLIACSRPGSQPATLQGIWNEEMLPAWDSKYTININLEMNYWLAGPCALSECQMPLFDLLRRMQTSGRHVARDMYGCRGFVAHHNTDLWGDCAPQDLYLPATYWPMGAAWLCTHIWTHYLYTRDESFLAEMFPVLSDAVLFFHDYLIDVNGVPTTCPSVSPENTYILPDGTRGCNGAGCTMDYEILRDLMQGYLKAADVLGIQDEQTARTREILRKLPPLKIGRHGQICEWREDFQEAEPGHRHISHLYALHPSHQISVDATPVLAQAARTTLERRLQYGGGHTGWSCAWIVNFYARLCDGAQALNNLQKLWRNSTFTNLMDNHPRRGGHVFQIDGNLGATAAIAEMLVQADETRVLLLPALPPDWQEGQVRGLALPGGAYVSLTWCGGALTGCTVTAVLDGTWLLRWREQTCTCTLKAGQSHTWVPCSPHFSRTQRSTP